MRHLSQVSHFSYKFIITALKIYVVCKKWLSYWLMNYIEQIPWEVVSRVADEDIALIL